MTADAQLLVLDAHGVVFNRPFPGFVRELAERVGRDPVAQWDHWRRELREPFWSGRITRADLWAVLAPDHEPAAVERELESRFGPGPLFDAVASSATPLWMLTNHRSAWILPRLVRFGIADRFERVLVSDTEGVAKPSPAAFRQVVDETDRRQVTVIDDKERNVQTARRLGLRAALVDDLPADLAPWAAGTTSSSPAPTSPWAPIGGIA